MSYIKYKSRFECPHDADIFFAAIQAFVDEWHVEPLFLNEGQSPYSIRNMYPDRSVTFTVSDELTLPMMRWILTRMVDLHVAAESLQLVESYTGKRINYDSVVTEEPSQVVWHLVQYSLDYMYGYLADNIDLYRGAYIALAVPHSLKSTKRLRSKDKYVDKILNRYFDENSEKSSQD